MLDLIIIGGGPAGAAAGIYAARKQLKTVLIAEEIGGQSVVSDGIENWIGTPKISGTDLAKSLRAHLDAVAGTVVTLVLGERVISLEKTSEGFTVTMVKAGQALNRTSTSAAGRSVLIASGASRRKLDVPGAVQFENRGVTYCASCDGPLFAEKDVAVIGGGNAGFETALQLLAYAKTVTLIHHRAEFKADPVTVAKALAYPNMRAIANAEPTEIVGGPSANGFVTGLKYRDNGSGTVGELAVSGIFVEIGVAPNTPFVKGLVDLDEVQRIIVDPKNQRASIEGIWAAGDCTDELYHQNNIAAGDGVKALEDIYLWIKKQ